MAWDPDALNRQFKSRAEDHRLYLRQCRERAPTNSSYERQADEALAAYQAHDYFADRTFLSSRERLIAQLRSIRDRDYTPSEVFDAETYQRRWRAELDGLISRFSQFD